jgi:putative ATP-dependent endonuclease of OLD family
MTGTVTSPLIRRLTIERFHGINKLVWHPTPGVNVILGGGDVGKTTILEAIALLLHPTNTVALSDADYWRREVENGFCIEAVMSLPDGCGINQQTKNAWPWEWNGIEPIQPDMDKEPGSKNASDTVYCLRVRGTADFDVAFEVLQPDATCDHFSVSARRAIGLVRLGGDDRNDRDLRLIQGSALDRLLSDKTLRSRLGKLLGANDVEQELHEDAKARLTELDEAFRKSALPEKLGLGLTGGQGFTLNALIGLTASKDGIDLPLATWGAGTRRLAALEIAAAHHGESPIVVVDELERGLEPYRQRKLMDQLHKSSSQVFLTTHSAAALSAVGDASVWYMDTDGSIGRLPAKAMLHEKGDPETFLARIAVVVEGATEVGFVTALLKRAVGTDLLAHGIWVTDGHGNDTTLELLEGLANSGLKFGGFADNESRFPDRWAAVKQRLNNLLFRWPSGCTEENIIMLVPPASLEAFIRDKEDEQTGERLRTLAYRLGLEEKDLPSIKAHCTDLTAIIIAAATGTVPDDKKNADKSVKKALQKHAERWFKSVDGGRELADKVFAFGLWPQLKPQLLPFLNAIRAAVSLPQITDLPS